MNKKMSSFRQTFKAFINFFLIFSLLISQVLQFMPLQNVLRQYTTWVGFFDYIAWYEPI